MNKPLRGCASGNGSSEAIDAPPEIPREFLAEGDANGVEYQAGAPFRRRNRIALHVDHHRAADRLFAGRALSDYAPRLGRRRRLADGDYHGGFIFRIHHRPRTITRDGGETSWPAGAFNHAVCARWRGEDREGSRRRKDGIL